MKILTILGARPQFIKAAALSHAIRVHNQNGNRAIEDIIVHTGQHFDYNMSQVFFDELGITAPKHSLGINSATHGVMTGKMMMALDKVLEQEKPDVALVYGDTNSTLAGAICASKMHIPLAHVEAGLRAFNKKIPEEVNRVLTDHISDFLFCPSEESVQWLKAEGIEKNVFKTGDVMYDSALLFSARPASRNVDQILNGLKRPYVVVTVHRADNTDDENHLRGIISALSTIADKVDVLFFVHPRTKNKLAQLDIDMSKINVHEPVGYADLLHIVKKAQCVLTDSGGLQKEAFFLQVPCITLRNETEWMELVRVKANILTGPDPKRILSALQEMKGKVIGTSDIFGDGHAGTRIINTLLEKL